MLRSTWFSTGTVRTTYAISQRQGNLFSSFLTMANRICRTFGQRLMPQWPYNLTQTHTNISESGDFAQERCHRKTNNSAATCHKGQRKRSCCYCCWWCLPGALWEYLKPATCFSLSQFSVRSTLASKFYIHFYIKLLLFLLSLLLLLLLLWQLWHLTLGRCNSATC